jgi:hypothetical protein
MTVGQSFAGAASGGTHQEHAGFWRPGLNSSLAVEPNLPNSLPVRFELIPVAPNPSRDQVGFRLGIPVVGSGVPLRFRIFDVTGRLVTGLRLKESSPGWPWMTWDGRDALGAPAGPGVYFCRMDAGRFVASQRFVLLH